jgi:hypothetical protein
MSLEEIESSHTLGLVGKVDRVEGRGEGVNVVTHTSGLSLDLGIKYLLVGLKSLLFIMKREIES